MDEYADQQGFTDLDRLAGRVAQLEDFVGQLEDRITRLRTAIEATLRRIEQLGKVQKR